MQPTVISSSTVAGYPARGGSTVVRQVAQPGQQVVYASPANQTKTSTFQPAQTTRVVSNSQLTQAVPQTISSVVRPSLGSRTMVSSSGTATAPATPTPTTNLSASVPNMYVPSSMTTPATVTRSSKGSIPVASSSVRIQPSSAAQPAVKVVTPTPAGQTRPHTLAGPGYTQGAYEAKHQDDPQLQNLKELRKTSGLKSIPVSDGLSQLKAAAEDGKLSRARFVETYAALLQAHEVECPPESVQNAVFDLFDRDDNNVVDMMELICGISLLCSGSEDDKIQAVFKVFDENGDGFISMDEMFKFLTSVFKVVLTPNVIGVMNSMGVTVDSAEDLASVTALECFRTADLNNDGKLSIVEFKNWFYAPRNDPSFLFSPVRKLLL